MVVQHKKMNIPGIGMRIIKSAIAVVLCMVVNIVRGGDGIVFYSQLAALWCIQMYRDYTWKNAFQRTIGTLIGAIYGLGYLLVYPFLNKGVVLEFLVEIICIFVCIILVLYTTVLLRQNKASYFSCVVFLSIVINHIGDANPYIFVLNRFLDTMIGIAIGIVVNNFSVFFRVNKETLFVSGVDDILVDKNDKISAFSKVELNRLIERGMRFTVSTMRTPASLLEVLKDIHLQYPVIVMDGAALYDVKNSEYVREYVISSETAREMDQLLKARRLCYYVNVIIDDTLLIYYQDTKDEVNQALVKDLKSSPYRNYIKRDYPGDEKVVYFMVLDRTEKIHMFYDYLVELGYDKKLKIITYESEKYDGYSYVKIYNRNASKENMLTYLKETYHIDRCKTYGTVEGKYDVLVHENSFNEMVKLLRRGQ